MLPQMPEPAGGLAGLDCFVAILRPLPEMTLTEKADLLAAVALELDAESRALLNRVIALEKRVTELERL